MTTLIKFLNISFAPPLKERGFLVNRADLSINQQQILKDIVNYLAQADLVIADVSGLNGNVMYELGLAHGLGRRTVMITRNIDELPFDLRSYRATSYSTHFMEAEKLKQHLGKIADATLQRSIDFGNPVQDFAPKFFQGQEWNSLTVPETLPKQNNENSGDDDLGLFDYSVQLNESVINVNEIASESAGAIEALGQKIVTRTEQINRTTANLGEQSAPALQILFREMAQDFDAFSIIFERNNPLLGEALSNLGQSTNGLARLTDFTTNEARKAASENIDSLLSAETTYEEVYVSINNFSITLGNMIPLEKTLTRAIRRAAGQLDETAQYLNSARSEIARARGLLEERMREA